MSFYRIPNKVRDRLEQQTDLHLPTSGFAGRIDKLRKGFLWYGQGNVKKDFHCMSFLAHCLSESRGLKNN